MVRHNAQFLILALVILITGCDPVYGPPSVRNDFNASVDVKITFADGDSNQLILLPCRALALGGIGSTSKMNVRVEQILIHKEGSVIHDLDTTQAMALIEKEKAHSGYSVWSIGPDGIQFIVNPQLQNCSNK